jgi:trk system potassium uptake protein TrkH
VRVLLIYKQGLREIHRLIHPNAIFPIKVNRQLVSSQVIEAIWGFFSIYVIAFLVMLVVLMGLDLDFVSAFSAVGACLNNLGPGLGDVAQNYGSVNAPVKLLLCFAMILGRLEIFPFLVVFTPMFWKK